MYSPSTSIHPGSTLALLFSLSLYAGQESDLCFKKGKYLLGRAFPPPRCDQTFCNKYIKAKNVNK